MKIKKFIAASLQEGKQRILKELGDDAVILSSRSINKQGDSNSLIEIVAAIDDTVKKVEKDVEHTEEDVSTEETISNEKIDKKSDLIDEIADLKYMIEQLNDTIKYKYIDILGEKAGKLYKKLIDEEFSEQYALSIVGKIKDTVLNRPNYVDNVRNYILNNIKFQNPISKGEKRKLAVFVGSTGSGKTTSLVKIAIILKLVFNSNVLIVTADTEKIGGADQLQTYSSIAAIPFQTAYSSDDLLRIVESETDRDFILIDTPGKSYLNDEYINELQELIEPIDFNFVFLVQNTNVNRTAFNSIMNKFSVLKPNGMILTKLDETENLGIFLESLQNYNVPLAYLSFGQKIPDDIEAADREKLSALILTDFEG